MTTQTRTNTPDELHEPAAVLEAVPATALDGQTGTGPIAIFYGAARYPFELARQRELVEDYAEATGLNLVTEFHDRQTRQHGLQMLLDACQRGGVAYVITAGWPTPQPHHHRSRRGNRAARSQRHPPGLPQRLAAGRRHPTSLVERRGRGVNAPARRTQRGRAPTARADQRTQPAWRNRWSRSGRGDRPAQRRQPDRSNRQRQ